MVVLTVVIVKLLFGGSKKRPKTLMDSSVKYPLKLVDKVVSCAIAILWFYVLPYILVPTCSLVSLFRPLSSIHCLEIDVFRVSCSASLQTISLQMTHSVIAQ